MSVCVGGGGFLDVVRNLIVEGLGKLPSSPGEGRWSLKFRLELLDGRVVVWRNFQTELGTTRLPKLDVLQPNAFISRLGQLYFCCLDRFRQKTKLHDGLPSMLSSSSFQFVR
jgi:hypothetical protein